MLNFEKRTVHARIVLPTGEAVKKPIEIRTHPITRRTCRVAFSRSEEREPATEQLPPPPPSAEDRAGCPFCPGNLGTRTPRLVADLEPGGRMTRGESVLFPNLFPYGSYSAVSLFDDAHFVEIGTASPASYADSFMNCRDYLVRILARDPEAVHLAVTQNHLPSAGGSLVHPHLQVQADRIPANHQRSLGRRAADYLRENGRLIFSDYLKYEHRDGRRLIGVTGDWEWVAAYAPEGFYEIWGVLPGVTSLCRATDENWRDLAHGVLNAQRFYRCLKRNGYNLGLLCLEDGSACLELRIVILARPNHAAWTRSDRTGFEVMLGDMATFSPPEETAERARAFWP